MMIAGQNVTHVQTAFQIHCIFHLYNFGFGRYNSAPTQSYSAEDIPRKCKLDEE